MVRQLAEQLRRHKSDLGTLIAMETGKIKAEGDGEVQEMIDTADLAVGQSRMLYGNSMHSERPGHRMYEQWHPLGVVGVITAFNFPMAVWAWNAFIAAIAGNTVVWKPSSKAPLCAIALQHICNQVLVRNELPGVFSLVIPEDHALADRFVDDARIPLVSVTGSTATGRRVAIRVAARFGRTILELSGNNAVIVDKSADIRIALPAIVFGAVGTAGQRCTTTRRLFVHRARLQELSERLTMVYGQIKVGDPLDADTLMGPLIDASAVQRYSESLAEIRRLGGTVLWGGNQLDRPGHFVEPTLVLAENGWPVVQHETFAPILYLIPFDDLEQAIALQNDSKQGLSSAIFTDRLQHAETFLSVHGSDCGIANVNIGTSGAEIGGAFGGEKETGGGREAGSDVWKSYMRRQTCTINWSRELPLAQGLRFDIDA
jgi:aldehyde dehydrogenase (NAD+)